LFSRHAETAKTIRYKNVTIRTVFLIKILCQIILIPRPPGRSDWKIRYDSSGAIKGRPGGLGSSDLWISFPEENSDWGAPLNLGKKINSEASDFGPFIPPNEKYLFFSSYRTFSSTDFTDKNYTELIEMYKSPFNGYASLYWIDAQLIADLRKQDLNE